MKPWFLPPERQAALDAVARTWEGTPYLANNASRGAGVGCVELQHEIWRELGACPPLELPRYRIDFGHHATEPQLLRFLLDAPALRGRLVFVPFEAPPLPGDLLACRSGRTDHHLAQRLPWGKVVHAVEGAGVLIHDEAERKFRGRVVYILRLLAP